MYTEFSGNLTAVQASAFITTILLAASSSGCVSSLSPFVLKETWPLVEIPKILVSTKGDQDCSVQPFADANDNLTCKVSGRKWAGSTHSPER